MFVHAVYNRLEISRRLPVQFTSGASHGGANNNGRIRAKLDAGLGSPVVNGHVFPRALRDNYPGAPFIYVSAIQYDQSQRVGPPKPRLVPYSGTGTTDVVRSHPAG